VSRFKKAVFMLVAAVMLLAAGVPASAETVAGKQRAEISAESIRKPMTALPSWWRSMWAKFKSRYAMAAN
jgi:hypothetical protein